MGFRKKEVEKLLVDTGRLCCICPSRHNVSLHHIKPREEGGSDDIDNAIPLCPSCHDEVHGSKASGRTTKAYTESELKLFRQTTIEWVSRARAQVAGSNTNFPIWQVPHRRNPNFTGRNELLENLHKTLTSGNAAAITQAHAIHGLGGIGKTQLAVEYTYRFAKDHKVIWWIRSEEPTTLASDFAALANKLDLAEKDAREQEVVIDAVQKWLASNGGWLLVFDNVPHRDNVRKFIPQDGNGNVIITSRDPIWSGVAKPLKVEVMSPEDAVAFLIKRTGENNEEVAADLAEELGYLPLALEQAAAYMEYTGKTLVGYRELFHTHKRQLLAKGELSTEYPDTVATTWEISFEQVAGECPLSVDLLNLCAFLAPDDIPLDLLTSVNNVPNLLKPVLADPILLDDAVAALRRYSLIDVSVKNLSIHRLVQEVMRGRLTEDETSKWAFAILCVIINAFPVQCIDVQAWPLCAKLLPHALMIAKYTEGHYARPYVVAYLFNQIGNYFWARAEYNNAKTMLEHAIKIGESVYGPKHPNVATSIGNLGAVLYAEGDLENAKKQYERALKIGESVYGPEHPNVAACIGNLGAVLKDLGNLEGAKKQYERALKIYESAYGPEHPYVANSIGGLGTVLYAEGDLENAKKQYERALKIGESVYGPEHPNVADSIGNLGAVLQDLGDLEGAKKQYERALKIDESAYGPEHPDVARDLNNLGSVMQALRDPICAKKHLERALQIGEAVYGLEHPHIATSASNLGNALLDLGDLEGAKKQYERALQIGEAVYGLEHPHIATSASNLGNAILDLGDLEGAKKQYERALGILKKSLPEGHPNIAIVQQNLDILLSKLNNPPDPK